MFTMRITVISDMRMRRDTELSPATKHIAEHRALSESAKCTTRSTISVLRHRDDDGLLITTVLVRDCKNNNYYRSTIQKIKDGWSNF